jgi:hypothetical protein
MDESQREAFEYPEVSRTWPEIGSRAFQRLVTAGTEESATGWVTVQPGRYRYLASLNDGIEVRMVMSEYLAGYVRWGD